ncbi:hypothetical protein ACQUY5_25730 [Bacillus cereus]|uniref:hypothetical protein n=1 Tax=Bacillus cereus TaxID=1396 RepID=UPI003D184DEF
MKVFDMEGEFTETIESIVGNAIEIHHKLIQLTLSENNVENSRSKLHEQFPNMEIVVNKVVNKHIELTGNKKSSIDMSAMSNQTTGLKVPKHVEAMLEEGLEKTENPFEKFVSDKDLALKVGKRMQELMDEGKSFEEINEIMKTEFPDGMGIKSWEEL